MFSADEGDHFSGANVGRSIDPTSSCTGTPATTGYTCSYPAGSIGEEEVDIHGLLEHEFNDTTPSTTSRREMRCTSPATRARPVHDPAARA